MRHILPLTSLRFFAAFLVVLFHAQGAWCLNLPLAVQNMLSGGYIGVPFFFVLSGFILAHNYIQGGNLRGSRSQFYVSRVARIYPVYLLALGIASVAVTAAGLGVAAPYGWAGTTTLSLLLVQSWFPAAALWLNGAAWSLSVEASFYCVFPFLVSWSSRRGRICGLLSCAPVCVLALVLDRQMNGSHLFQQIKFNAGFSFPLLWLPLFVLGIVLAEVKLPTAMEHSVRSFASSLLLIGVIVAVLCSGRFRSSTLLFCYIVAVPCALVIFVLARERSFVARVMSHPALVLLGEASYALYITHKPLYQMWNFFFHANRWLTPEAWPGVTLYVLAAVGVSVVVLHVVERPARAFIVSIWKRRSAPAQKPQVVGVY